MVPTRILISGFALFLTLASHTIKAQAQKTKVYVDTGTSKRYSQSQYDSIARAVTATDPDKVIMIMSQQESPGESQFNFATLTIKSLASVRRQWLNKKLPDFSFRDTTGKVYNNATIADKVVVLNLWSTTCHPCIDEMPLLNTLVNRYVDQEVLFLALAPENTARIANVLTKHPFTYTILPQAQSIFKALDAPGYPYHIVVDRQGYMRYIQSGTTNGKTGEKIAESELPAAIEQALK